MTIIYLDHNATTPIDSRVLDAMLPYFRNDFGNASSLDHRYGYRASEAVEAAREKIAKSIGARHDDVIFTSGATESNNLALIGTMERYRERGDHLVTCVTEHEAILNTAKRLESMGKSVTYLPVNEYGMVDPADVDEAITDRTVMVSIMAANNEIGVTPDIAEIGRITHDRGVLFHTDAAQAVGHMPINVEKMKIDLMSFSAHKMYGPKGVGALYVRGIRPRVRPHPIMYGGGQENNLRSGTLNVPGIVGFGEAASIASKCMYDENVALRAQATVMLRMFEDAGAHINGHREQRLAGNLNAFFPGIEGKAIINSVSDRVAISAGSACTTESVEPSHVIMALGYGDDRAHSSIRLGMGRFTKPDESKLATSIIIDAVKRISKY